jgi:hypothetical protein
MSGHLFLNERFMKPEKPTRQQEAKTMNLLLVWLLLPGWLPLYDSVKELIL